MERSGVSGCFIAWNPPLSIMRALGHHADGFKRRDISERFAQEFVRENGHRQLPPLTFAVESSDHIVRQLRGIEGFGHGIDGREVFLNVPSAFGGGLSGSIFLYTAFPGGIASRLAVHRGFTRKNAALSEELKLNLKSPPAEIVAVPSVKGSGAKVSKSVLFCA